LRANARRAARFAFSGRFVFATPGSVDGGIDEFDEFDEFRPQQLRRNDTIVISNRSHINEVVSSVRGSVPILDV